VRDQPAEGRSKENVRRVDTGRIEKFVEVGHAALAVERTPDGVALSHVGAVVHARPMAVLEQALDRECA
jgi:hypothetical protein